MVFQLQLQLTVGYFSVILSFQLQLQLIEITVALHTLSDVFVFVSILTFLIVLAV